ncbi:decarboxylating NADP(+)-dependent phosphogluconate dehydrogenase [Coprobacter sp.]
MKVGDLGLIGLGVMGANLALNFERNGYTVAVYNRKKDENPDIVSHFIKQNGEDKNFIPADTIEELVSQISRPRKIMLMVKAGDPVDELISQLLPYLSLGDIVIDGGNSDFRDTARRVRFLEDKGFWFVGCGISGGAEGALWGPSIMPGGSEKAWPLIKDMLQAIAAKLEDGSPCCRWIGSGGSGHFVKMVHNGIEYGDMQLIAESYAILKQALGLTNDEISSQFELWNQGELDSYLIEITASIFRYKEKSGEYLIDKIRDVARQKGTGRWSVEAALDEGEPLTLITQAVYARMLSALSEERNDAASFYPGRIEKKWDNRSLAVNMVKDALYASKLISYAQGFSLMQRASVRYGWNLDCASIAFIWQKGCIIRSVFLKKVVLAYEKNPELKNLLFDNYFRKTITSLQETWRQLVSMGLLSGIPLPCMTAGLTYFDGLRTKNSTANLIQAQRDFFGAHTYERLDADSGFFFHTDWERENN